jgi:hypothetical protein
MVDMNALMIRLPILAGTAATALLLGACGADTNEAPAPVAPATVAAEPSATATSAAPSSSTPASPSSSSSPAAENTVEDNRAELDVDDQRGDGRSVLVQEARLTSGTGFVAIYNRDNKLLGSAKIGSAPAVTVKVDERITTTAEYRAVLFADEGDGSFDAKDDRRVVESDDDGSEAIDDDFDYRVS